MTRLLRVIKRNLVTSLYYIFRVFPINNKKIYVKNFFGKGYGDSPKYIIDYLIRHYMGYDVVWCVNNDGYTFPQGVRTVNSEGILGMIKNIYEQTTAKIWIDNSTKYSFERKRKKQYYIQTWHGDIIIKKIKGDKPKENFTDEEAENARTDAQMTNLHVCGNKWWQKRLPTMFFYDGEVATCGLPRRDVLYTNNEELLKTIKEKLVIPAKARILLFAPTFRDEEIRNHRLGNHITCFDWRLILGSLEKRFGGEWYGLMRLHPVVAKYGNSLKLPARVINATDYPDVNELLCTCDCCISDYSSTLLEFAINKKPGFIFAPDKTDYEGERGYYFSEEELPFPVSSSVEELNNDILTFNEEEYLKSHHRFYNEIIQMYPEGHASEYLAKLIVGVCGN